MNPAGERLEAVHSRADGAPLGIPAPGTPDANAGGVADTNDLSIILAVFGKVAGDRGYTVACDVDQAGDIDGKDYDAVSGWLGGMMGERTLSSSVTKSHEGFAGYEYEYDAVNRLRKVKNQPGVALREFTCNALAPHYLHARLLLP